MNNKIAKIDMLLLLLKSHHEITKKIFSSEIFTLSKMNFFPPFHLSFVFHTEMWEITLKINALWSLFSIFCKNWKNIFKLWGLSEIYIIDSRWSVLNRQIGDGKMCMQNSENEWVVCLRLRGYNMTTVLSLYGLCHKKSQNDPTKTPNDSCKF